MATICDKCKSEPARVFFSYGRGPHEFTIALCKECESKGPPYDLIREMSAQLPPPVKKLKIYVVIQSDENEENGVPVAAFLALEKAQEFVETKEEEGYLRTEWRIMPVPLEDFDA